MGGCDQAWINLSPYIIFVFLNFQVKVVAYPNVPISLPANSALPLLPTIASQTWPFNVIINVQLYSDPSIMHIK